MKRITIVALIAILSIAGLRAKAQATKDACTLISTEQLNRILGCKLTGQETTTMKGKNCSRKSADNKIEVSLGYFVSNNVQNAGQLMRMDCEMDKKAIADGKKAVGFYTTCTDFSEGGQYAHVMTGEGNEYVPGNGVRLKFLIGSVQFTFDTKGIDKNKVLPKLKEIYSIIKENNK